jgi:DNA-binding response OmpR family regulator
MASTPNPSPRARHLETVDLQPRATAPLSESVGPIRLALVDADTAFTQVIVKRSESRGWLHRTYAVAPRIEELLAGRPTVALIDPALCAESPWEYLVSLTEALPEVGLIVVATGSTVQERVRGLRLGADDWVVKPSHPEEVIARVESVARRRRRSSTQRREPVVDAELEIRPDRFQAFVGGESVNLTRREFELLSILAHAGDRVLERAEIYRRAWGYEMPHGDRSVDVFVRKLRKKLEAASPGWRYIHTHFGVGYRFASEPAPKA